MKLKKLAGILAIAGLAVPGIASATNGYFAHGYGMKILDGNSIMPRLPGGRVTGAENR